MTDADQPLAYTIEDVASLLGGVSLSSVRRLIDVGLLAKLPTTGRVLIARAELERYIASGLLDDEDEEAS